MNTENVSNRWISEGLVIASLPISGFVIGFAYEYGYTRYFGIPFEFIEVGGTKILYAAGSWAFYLIIAFGIFKVITKLLSGKHPLVRVLLNSLIPLISILVLYLPAILFWNKFEFLWFILGMWTLITLVYLSFPLIIQKSHGSYMKALDAINVIELRDQTDEEILFSSLFSWSKASWIWIFLTFIVTTYSFGGYSAKQQSVFLTYDDREDVVLIRRYGEYFVGKKYNTDTNTMEFGIVVIRLDIPANSNGEGKANVQTLNIVPRERGPLLQPK